MRDAWVRRIWERKGLWGHLLWIFALPLSLTYYLAIQMRNLLYTLEWIPTKNLPCAVVSVGNLTVGGTGKTPATLWLAQELGKKGYKVTILSRGYKRTGKGPLVLEPGLKKSAVFPDGEDSFEEGDEPVMMARLYGQRVGVGERRCEVGSHMLGESEVDLFLLDDGFQHRQLKRDVDVVLLGTDWKGWLLPAGPFREPRSALRRADLCLVTGSREKWETFLAHRPIQSIFFGSLQPKLLLSLDGQRWKEHPLGILDRSKILTVCAIANPVPFYRMIHEWEGEIVDTLEFPDHYSYSTKDWQEINRAARNADLIVTTEKDILKLVRFPFAREKLLALRVEMVVEDGEGLIRAVEGAIKDRHR